MSKEQIKKEAESLMKEFRNILADDDCTICVNDDDELAILKWHVQSKIKLLEEIIEIPTNGDFITPAVYEIKPHIKQQKEILKYLEEL